MKTLPRQRLFIKAGEGFTLGVPIQLSCIALIFMVGLVSSGCQQTGSAPKLQSHLQGATTAGQETGRHITNTRNSIERIDYKAGRAKRLLDEGFSK